MAVYLSYMTKYLEIQQDRDCQQQRGKGKNRQIKGTCMKTGKVSDLRNIKIVLRAHVDVPNNIGSSSRGWRWLGARLSIIGEAIHCILQDVQLTGTEGNNRYSRKRIGDQIYSILYVTVPRQKTKKDKFNMQNYRYGDPRRTEQYKAIGIQHICVPNVKALNCTNWNRIEIVKTEICVFTNKNKVNKCLRGVLGNKCAGQL